MPVDEISLGDYVLAGGEVAVLVIVEAVARLLPGVLGNAQSARRRLVRRRARRPARGAGLHQAGDRGAGCDVPPVLLSGHHGEIARWRAEQSRERTAAAAARPAGRIVPLRAMRLRAPCCGIIVGLPAECRARSRADRSARAIRSDTTDEGSESAMNTLDTLDAESLRSDVPDFRPGDTLKVHVRVVEGNRSRIQVFQGAVIRRQGGGIRETFTVRKVSFGVGVERTFPVHTPVIEKIEVVTRGDVRRAKLYYLRDLRGKKAKIKEKRETVAR